MKRTIIVAAVLFVASVLPVAAQAPTPTIALSSQEGIAYLEGGIGQDEVREMRARESEFNLKLVFSQRGGAYVADVDLAIEGGKDKVVFQIANAGPLVLVKLPPGSYRVKASSPGGVRNSKVMLGARRLSTLSLVW